MRTSVGTEMKERCREVLERAYLYLDGESLTEAERVEFRVHLEECRPCLERVGLEEEIGKMVSRLRGFSACPKELRLRIKAQIESL